MINFNGSQKVTDIISNSPNAAKVFIKNQVDFFNCGDKTLEEATKEKQVSLEEIMNELETSYDESKQDISEDVDWRNVKSSDIINHIIKYHHSFLKNELPATEVLLAKILKVHYDDSGEILTNAYRLYNKLKTEFEINMIKERRYFFPLILEYERAPSKKLLDKLLNEIKDTEEERNFLGYILKEIRLATNQYKVPPTGCPTFDLTYRKLQDIELNILYYLHLENNIMFAKFKR